MPPLSLPRDVTMSVWEQLQHCSFQPHGHRLQTGLGEKLEQRLCFWPLPWAQVRPDLLQRGPCSAHGRYTQSELSSGCKSKQKKILFNFQNVSLSWK